MFRGLAWIGAGLCSLGALAQPAAQPAAATPQPTIHPPPAQAEQMPDEETAPSAPRRKSGVPPDSVLKLLGAEVPPGSSRRLTWKASYGFGELDAPAPVQVANGVNAGPHLCITAAVHGDELNGIEIVRRVMQRLDTQKLSGAVIGVPIVNIPGFQRGSRYLPDRRDLNRFFPGDPQGSLASRIAHDFFHSIIARCDYLVDLHTGSFARSNLPQLRADLRNPPVLEMTKGFGAIAVLHTPGAKGTLRRAAAEAGIPSVTLEAGEPDRLQTLEVEQGVKGIESLMSHLGMRPKTFLWRSAQPVFYESHWVRADRGGILFSEQRLGNQVRVGDVLGTVTDPLSNVRTDLIAPHNGKLLGKALNQFVMPGFAAFRLGIETSQEQLAQEAQPGTAPAAAADPALEEKEKN